MKIVEFFFDFGSPASYLAYTQLPPLADAAGALIGWRPILLGGVFKATGNSSPVTVQAKRRWLFDDLGRWAGRYGVPFTLPDPFPINSLALMRGAVGLQMRQPERFPDYCQLVFESIWARGLNLSDPALLAATLTGAGFDAEAFAAIVADPMVKEALADATEEAVARGVFGAPSFFVGSELHFGQDRLDFVREALA